jgi:hypothetical protein
MSKLALEVEFEDAQYYGKRAVFLPGAAVAGTFTVEVLAGIRCRSMDLCLEWFTEGKGDRDRAVIASKELHSGPLDQGRRIGEPFRFMLPDQPWSYAGYLITIHWAISVVVDVPMGRDIRESVRFVMAPG